MYKAIRDLLLQGAIKNVYVYGSQIPAGGAPYIVIKPEPAPEGEKYRIIVHMLPGQQVFLRTYVRNDVTNLLAYKKITTQDGNVNTILPLGDWQGITIANDDGTISMERCFLVPSKLFVGD